MPLKLVQFLKMNWSAMRGPRDNLIWLDFSLARRLQDYQNLECVSAKIRYFWWRIPNIILAVFKHRNLWRRLAGPWQRRFGDQEPWKFEKIYRGRVLSQDLKVAQRWLAGSSVVPWNVKNYFRSSLQQPSKMRKIGASVIVFSVCVCVWCASLNPEVP